MDRKERLNQELERMVEERTAKLRRTLEEKEALLREVHHRTKNNMQLISSLLNLEYDSIDDPKAIEAINKSMSRIQALSTAHEYLHRSENIININLQDYINDFLANVWTDLPHENLDLQVMIQEDLESDIDFAIPFGLIVNELISNSYMHAFPNDTQGHISIEVHTQDSRVHLNIADNGVGLPAEIDIENSSTLGIELATGLSQQLAGSYHVERDGGTAWHITFPVAKLKS